MTAEPHRISLRRAWSCHPPRSLAEGGWVQRWNRSFHAPSGSVAPVSLRLRIHPVGPQDQLFLNGVPLGLCKIDTSLDLEIRDLMQARNELVIDLAASTLDCEPFPDNQPRTGVPAPLDVWLEIHDA
jgi:hypothetical protein